MMLCELLIEKCEEFFDLIPETCRTDEVEEIIDHVGQFLVSEIDGYTSRDARELAEEVEMRIEELWGLLPAAEKKTNSNLCDYFDDLIEATSRVLECSTLEDAEDVDDEDFDCDEEE